LIRRHSQRPRIAGRRGGIDRAGPVQSFVAAAALQAEEDRGCPPEGNLIAGSGAERERDKP
jgi:hypothetical protein